MKRIFTATCLIVLLAGSTAWGQPAKVSTLVDTLNASGGMVIGPDGMLYVSNFVRDFSGNHPFIRSSTNYGSEIYKVNPADGSVELFADGLRGPFAMAFDHDGNLLVTNVEFGTVDEISPEGGVSGFGTPGGAALGIAVAADSSVLVARCQGGGGHAIIRFPPNSSIFRVFIDLTACAIGLTLDDEDNIYVAFEGTPIFGGVVRKYGPDGSDMGVVASLAEIISPLYHVAYSAAASSLYVTAIVDHRVWKVTLDGAVSVLAGSGFPGTADGVGTSASFTNPIGIAVSVTGDTLYVNQTFSEGAGNPNSIRVITGVLNADTSPVANEDEAEVPEGFILAQNYPNPFNPSTSIRFNLPQAGHATLTVYDLSGRAVARLVDQPLHAGTHSLTWDASGLPSGTYLYRLTAGTFSQTKVMTLMK